VRLGIEKSRARSPDSAESECIGLLYLYLHDRPLQRSVCNCNKDIIYTYKPPLWDVTIDGPPRRLVWYRLVTVPTDPFTSITTFTRPTGPFLSE